VTKKELRQQLRQWLAALTPEDLQLRSAAACRNLCSLEACGDVDVVMIFLSMAQEVDTTQIALHAWSRGRRVLAPRVSWEQRRMLPIEITSLTTDVQAGPMGLREPVEGIPVPVSEIDLVIVPGLAFDEMGNRLGRGRGFYDRFLSHRDFHGRTCALAFQEQVVEEVPTGENDVRVDMLVTDARVYSFRQE